MTERLQKIISKSGICSRRAAEELLNQGRVRVNGLTASVGESADIDIDEITVDGKRIFEKDSFTYVLLNKPRGYVTTLSDESGRKTVSQLVSDTGVRLYPVGRLDMYSEGLLLMTNDGDLTYRLTHPKHEVYKQYLVRITYEGVQPTEPPDIALSRSMVIDGVKLLPAKCRITEKTDERHYIILISIREGKNRQIRKMCALCGYTVNSLKRIAIGDLKLGDLVQGKYRYLTEQEINYLKNL